LQAKWRVLYFNEIDYIVVIAAATAIMHSYLLPLLPFPLYYVQCTGKLSGVSHYTESMHFIILSKKSLGLVLFCLKRVNIMTPLVVSVDVLLTINMSNTSTRSYTLDI